MAKSGKPVTPSWGALLTLDARTRDQLRTAPRTATQLVRCGGGRDAVVIAPLQRGLAALDAMNLPVEDGYSILADHLRQELIVLVASGWAHNWTGVAGVRALSLDSWLLVPASDREGSLASAWLSRPKRCPRWADTDGLLSLSGVTVGVDVADLCDALATIDRPVLPAAAGS
jgi:hypothetical protein